MQARYVHTNLIARDWQRLVNFYQRIFHCTPVVADSTLSGEWLERVSGVGNAQIRLCHLRLPGHGDTGPTLEIIAYNHIADGLPPAANRPGFGHIAFAVDDVEAAQAEVLAAGGGAIGEMIVTDMPGRGRLTAIYATDPEGNILELQHWG